MKGLSVISKVQKLGRTTFNMNSNIDMQTRTIRYIIPPDFNYGLMRGDLYPHMVSETEKILSELDDTKCEEVPHARYEYLKPSQARVEKANRKAGSRARRKVKALLDLLDIKAMIKSR